MAAPAIIVIGIIFLYPVGYTIWVGFFKLSLTSAANSAKWIGIKNYLSLLKDPTLRQVIQNTITYVIISVPLEILFGLMSAQLLDPFFRGRNIIRALWLVPFMFTPVVVAYQWKWLFNDQSGLINYILMSLGIIDNKIAWLSDPLLAMPSVIITDIWFTTPFVTLLLLAGIQSLPIEPFESAEVDGASGWQKFLYIRLPLLRPIMLVVILLKTMDAMKVFDHIYIMTYGGPGLKTEVIMTYAYKIGFVTFNVGQAAAVSVFSLFLMLLTTGIILLLFRQKSLISYY